MTMILYGYTYAPWSVDFILLGAFLAYWKDIGSGNDLLYM